MTNNYLENRIGDIERIAKSLKEEQADPDSKGPRHLLWIQPAITELETAAAMLRAAITCSKEDTGTEQ